MNWEAILKAYPEQKDVIEAMRSVREKIERAMGALNVPEISKPYRDMEDSGPFIPLIAPACTAVWKECIGAEPAFDMTSAIEAVLLDKDLPSLPEKEADTLFAIIQDALSRFVHLLKEKNPQVLPETWLRGDCPFCGASVTIAFDAEEKRELHCLSCSHSWRFPRLRCPSCGNTDQNTLGYFDAEGIDGARVYFCQGCKGYYKVIDTRVRIETDPETEDALTMELDELALKEGFTNEP